ncbi:MAG TPA: DUF5695 domain-containing protein [Terriglobales bacterium]|nr:DUF5695 domain-containing protein [Terriglobales bacterium]
MKRRALVALALVCLFVLWNRFAYAESGTIQKGSFRFVYSDGGVAAIANPNDPHGAQVTRQDRPLGLTIRYQTSSGAWEELKQAGFTMQASPERGSVMYTLSSPASPVKVVQTFKAEGEILDWTIDIDASGSSPVTVGDLGINIPEIPPYGEEPKQIFERSFVRHQFISGNGSFLYFVRPSGVPPFLVVTVRPGTKLEYFARAGREGTVDYVHSGATGTAEIRGTWRQPHTVVKLGPKGTKTGSLHYGFRFQWAKSYDELRAILYREGLFDVRAVPGMTIPEDLTARFALHTKARIEVVEPEFPDKTKIKDLGASQPGYRLYEVQFQKLGENKLTIRHDGGRTTYLEYFVTEPLETLIKKRSAFIINRQQIRDTSKWWDGVFAPYDMRAKTVRTFDDVDIFKGRMVYVLTCDDPGLSKAPYVAAKNVSFPDQKEIEGLEYYLQHFVWGKLQRTGEEVPYPYGVYGTPDWYTNRDPQRRAKVSNTNLDKMHVWRSYDYPHIVMLYFHMYEIAKKYPHMSKYLDAAGYLDRAYNTARAFFTYPYEIMPDYYETYKWGLYNELIVLKLADELDREGFPERATWLRAEWEKKVKYFVYDDQYPFRSEYAFDRTAFESTYALAKYGATNDMMPDQNLWWDIKYKKWHSHRSVKRQDSRDFMERQLAAGLTVRGWLEPSYHQLGSDPGMSYMAAMGGWGILDYALNFASQPHDWLQLGYASYLSSWALMNTGRPDTNYGYWYPGKENDGAAGWQYMSDKWGYAWMGDTVPRGAWRYDGEIDLGFGGALRMASTILTRDPLFDWTVYGGELSQEGGKFAIVPKDGLRQRFAAVVPDEHGATQTRTLKLELDRDGFAAGQAIVTDQKLGNLSFTLENRTQDKHSTGLWLSIPDGSQYEVMQNGRKLSLVKTNSWDYPWKAEVEMSSWPTKIDIIRVQQRVSK